MTVRVRGSMSRGPSLATYAWLGALALLVSAVALAVGPGDLANPTLRGNLLALRGGRVAAAFLSGAALAVAGVVVQGLFRNPLACPSVLGTIGGASFGGHVALLAGQALLGGAASRWAAPEMLLPVGSVLGALLALVLLLVASRFRDELVVVLLTGFLVSSLFMSLGGLVTSLAQEHWELARAMLSFSLGDVAGASPRQVAVALPLALGGTLAAWQWGRPLDLLLTGEEEAATLGVDIAAVRRWGIVWTALLTAAAVSAGGNVSFVGLIVPHVLRSRVGGLHRRLVPAAFLAGGVFVVACDLLARLIPARTELPLGVVTGLIGAPVFFGLLLRTQRASGGW